MSAPTVDWEQVKAEYIAGDDSVTVRWLADKYGVHYTTIANHSRSEGWTDARKVHRQQVANKTLSRVSTTESELRAKQLRVCDALLAKGLAAMQSMSPETFEQARRAVETALREARAAAGIAERTEADDTIRVIYDGGSGTTPRAALGPVRNSEKPESV